MNCLRCGAESTISVCMVLSTKGCRPRLQKSSKALQFCSTCMGDLKRSEARKLWTAVQEALQGAYTSLHQV